MIAGQSDAKQGRAGAPKVSVVLPVYNSKAELSSVVSELARQSYPNREIVVVDDGSTDGTWDTAKELYSGRDDIELVRTEHRGASHARNEGVEKATGDVIFFAESDCTYSPSYIQKAVDSLAEHPDAGAVCLTGAPMITRSTLATRSIDIENKMQHVLLSRGKIKPFYAWVYTRRALLGVGGFDERLFQGEDKDLFGRLKKAGYSVAWVPGVNWWHRRDQTTSQLARKWFIRGRTRLLYALKNRRTFEILKTLAPFWATVIGLVLLPFVPLLGAAMVLIVALAFLAHATRVASITWSEVERKRDFLGYPLFVVTRNFSMALGYSFALVAIIVRKIEGRKVAWDSV